MQTKSLYLGLAAVALVAAALVAPATPALAGPGYVNFTIGQKMFDEDDWGPIDKQTAFGAEAAWGPSTWPVQLATFLSRASKEKDVYEDFGLGGSGVSTVDATTTELGIGLNKSFGQKRIRPYIGAGGLYTKTNITLRQSGYSSQDDANGFGFWGGAGAFYRLGTAFNLGGGVRYTSATVDYEEFQGDVLSYPSKDVAAGGVQIHVLIGWSWPKMAP